MSRTAPCGALMQMFRNFIDWIRDRFFPDRDNEDDLRESGVRVRPPSERPAAPRADRANEVAEPPVDLRFDAEIGGRIEDAGPGKNVLVRSKYLSDDTGTHDALKIIDENAVEDDEDAGIDPYNTGQFDRSKNWNRRFRD